MSNPLNLLVVVIVTFAFAVFVLAILPGFFVDRGACFASHQEMGLFPMLVGKTTVMIPRNHEVCDQWEYPEGKPE